VSVRDDQRNSLPSGTVTLFFADLEGSTKLLHALGERYGPVRARKRELVRATAHAHGGREVDWAGDGVFLAFERATDAVEAAVELQTVLAAEPWPADAAVRLRIGIHTGEPSLDEGGYVGVDVHLASRICDAAHGGQVVVSRVTRDFLGESAQGIEFRPLGSYRLKDVPRPEQLFQLLAPGLPEAFPPLKTLGGATLPSLHHRLVGRRADLTATLSLLARRDVRLVTITGPGGGGKSRLALEIAALAAVERPVHLVGLASVADSALVPTAIAHALGVQESATRPPVESIADELSGTDALLVLDNFEHVLPAARDLLELLDRAPDLDALVTSRAPLRLSAEHVVPLPPLTTHDASTLFAELAAARGVVLHDDALPAIREICRRLDGLPLAIELVAARLAILPPAQLLGALDEGLALDMEGPVDLPERQRTLRAAIDWSYGLLSESQRAVHQALAVFAGGCTLDDGKVLAGGGPGFLPDLEALVAGSLLRSDVSDGELRLAMLETVRENALARSDADGTLEDLRRRHAERFLELALSAEPGLVGPDQADWLDRIDRELDNVRSALDWFLTSGRVEDALRAASALGRFWRGRGHVAEARRWFAQGLARAGAVSPAVRADALWTAARQAMAQSAEDEAVTLIEDALGLYRELGDGPGVAVSLTELGWIALERGDADRAEALCSEGLDLARASGDERVVSRALMDLGAVCSARGDHARALELHEEALALRRALGDTLLVSDAIYNLGLVAFQTGDHARAREAFGEALTLAEKIGEALHSAAALFMLAELDLLADRADLAEQRIRESLATYVKLEDRRDIAECFVVLAGVLCARGDVDDAARLLGAAEELRGDAPVDFRELPVLERFEPELQAALGADGLATMKREGADLGLELAVREVVRTGT
jgi:predicted ATPase/class 3 adenylate cyclase